MLFSDIEGSTGLVERAGPGYLALLDVHRVIIRDELCGAGGVEHGTEGDSFFISFGSPSAAVPASVRMQRRLESQSWPAGLRLRVRMGLHIGEVEEHDGT